VHHKAAALLPYMVPAHVRRCMSATVLTPDFVWQAHN